MLDEFSVYINAAPEIVYPFLSEADKIIKWRDTDSAAYGLHYKGPARVGDLMTVTPKGLFPAIKRWTMVARGDEVVPGARVVHKYIAGPLLGTDTWVVGAAGAGTRMAKIVDYEITGLLNGFLWRLAGRRLHATARRTVLGKLKSLVETANNAEAADEPAVGAGAAGR